MPENQTVVNYLFRDLCQFYTHHVDAKDTDEFWKKLHDNAVMMEKKYRSTEVAELARKMTMGIVNAIDEKVRKENGKVKQGTGSLQ